MPSVEKIIERMRHSPSDVRFDDAVKVCRAVFGAPRQNSGSHVVFKTPWIGDPRINLQNQARRAKAYQVRQILAALDKLQAF